MRFSTVSSSVLLCAAGASAISPASSPVLIVPGTGGNRLEAKLNKPSAPHFYCSKNADWFDLWLDVKQLLPGAIDCWCDNIRLVYDTASDSFSNSPGVDVRVPCYGEVCGVEYLDESLKVSDSAYFHDLIEAFAQAGYVRGANIRSAPYDFRYSPAGDPSSYVSRTVSLVEEMYADGGGVPVTLVSHSMGSLWTHYLLHGASREWKDKHVACWVALAPAYGGTAKELRLFASGDNEGIPLVSGLTVRGEQRSYESNFWLLPNKALWSSTEVLVSTPARNYTAHDVPELLQDAGFEEGPAIYKRFERDPALTDLSDPGVAVHVRYGVGVDTPESFRYDKAGDFNTVPDMVLGDGDGTVNRRGLEAGMNWQSANHKAFSGVDHTAIVKNKEVIDEILTLTKAA